MKLFKYINTSLWILGVLFLASCSDTVVDEVLDTVESGAILRNLGETNNLDISDPNSTYTIILEAQDPTGGSLLEEVRINVGFFDVDDMGTDTVARSAFAVMPASVFNETSPTTNNLPVGTFSTTLSALLGHIGSSIGDIGPTDVFEIDLEMVLTDGRIFNRANATGDVTRTGRFSFFNAQFRYSAAVGDRNRLVVDAASINNENGLGILNDGAQDTVFVTFDRTPTFVTTPTITRTSVTGATDDVIGALTQLEDEDYFFIYTAGASAVDTVSFEISGGSVEAGFVMESVEIDDAYIIDNVAPSGTVGDVVVSTNGGTVSSVSVTLSFTESLGEDDVVFSVNSADFDDTTIDVSIAEGATSITVVFSPAVGGTAISDTTFSFDLVTDEAGGMGAGITDLVGNEMSRTYTVDVF